MKHYVKYIAALLLFGFNGVVASAIDLTSMQITLMRTLLGGTLMTAAALAAFTLRRRPRKPASQKLWRDVAFVVASGVCMGVSWMFQYEAFRRIGVGPTSLIYCIGPVLIVAVSPVLFGEAFRARRLAGFALALAGVLLVNARAGGAADAAGIACALMCAVAYAAMIVLNKQAHGLHDIDNSALQLAAAFAVCVAACAAAGEAPFAVSEGSIAPMLTLGLVNTGFGCYLYFSSIGKLSAQSVAVCDYLEPLSAVVLAGAFLGESLTATQTLGAALIICGALGSELGGKPRKPRYLNRSATNPQQETAHRTAKTKETKQD